VWRGPPAPDGGPAPTNWQSGVSPARRGPAWYRFHEPTARSTTCTRSRRTSRTSTGTTPRSRRAMPRTCCTSGSTGAWTASGSTSSTRSPKTRNLATNEPGLRHDEELAHYPQPPAGHPEGSIDEYDGRLLVGEVYLMDLHRLVEYINSGDQLHLAHKLRLLPIFPGRQRLFPRVSAGLRRSGGFLRPGRPGSWRTMTTRGGPHALRRRAGVRGSAGREWPPC